MVSNILTNSRQPYISTWMKEHKSLIKREHCAGMGFLSAPSEVENQHLQEQLSSCLMLPAASDLDSHTFLSKCRVFFFNPSFFSHQSSAWPSNSPESRGAKRKAEESDSEPEPEDNVR